MAVSPYQRLIDSLRQETIVLTPNNRLAAHLKEAYEVRERTRGREKWSTPLILPLLSYLRYLFHTMSESWDNMPYLLNEGETTLIWKKIIKSSYLVDRMQSAWELLMRYDINPTDHQTWQTAFPSQYDYHQFHQWCIQFESYCQNHHVIQDASLANFIHQALLNGKITVNEKIILVGFAEIEPQYQRLLNELTHEVHNINDISIDQASISFFDEEEETVQMARWASQLFHQNPDLRIGCIIPSLEKKKGRVEQIFSEFIDKDHFNLSASLPLLSCPMIHIALLISTLDPKAIRLTAFVQLLHSPFLGEGETELMERAILSNILQNKNVDPIAIDHPLIKQYCPYLSKRLNKAFLKTNQKEEQLPYATWCNDLSICLHELGWPGERSLNSEEYQTLNTWYEVLETLSALDHIIQRASREETLETLAHLCKMKAFHPKTPASTIQILGPLEGAGLPFDYLWVSGIDDIAWPAHPNPHPFIPKELQRKHNMPHATFEHEIFYSRHLLNQFKKTSSHLIYSFAKHKDHGESNISPLIKMVPPLTDDTHLKSASASYNERIFAKREMEEVMEPPLQFMHHSQLNGGVKVLQDQANCAFKAFARWRLNAHQETTPSLGLSMKEQGILIHGMLQMLWEELKNQKQLLHMTRDRLNQFIDHVIQVSFQRHLDDWIHLRQHYLDLMKEYFHSLLLQTLELEMKRQPFDVLSCENECKIKIDQLTLSCRIDRIDAIGNDKLIIDYKTGQECRINQWLDERMEEPQLPLYALSNEHATGIAFMHIRPKATRMKGLSAKPLGMASIEVSHNWEGQKKIWQYHLTKLAHEFMEGKTHINPKHGDDTCQKCQMHSLCRVNEGYSND